jgi:hypothetical protein
MKESKRTGIEIFEPVILFILIFVFLFNWTNNNYVVNQKSGFFHKMSCKYAKQINPRHRKFEAFRDVFVKEGFSPCSTCKP